MPIDTHMHIRLLTFTGASGSGKTTLIDAVMKARPELERVISCTTRPKRSSDPLGEYAYLSDEEFTDYVDREAFLWTSVFSHYRYGTLRRSVDDALSAKYPRIMTLTPDKTALLRALHPSSVLSFLIVVSDADVLERRMRARGDAPAEIRRRIRMNLEWERGETVSSIPYIRIDNSGSIPKTVASILSRLPDHPIA